MDVLANVAHLVIVVSALAWLVLALAGRRAGRGGPSTSVVDDPNIAPPDVATRPPDPGLFHDDYTVGLPVRPLPPRDTP